MNIIENIVAGRWRPDLFCIFDAIRIFRCKINETNEVPQSDCSILLRSPKYLSATNCCLCSATSMLRRKYCSMGIPMLRLQTCGTRNLLYCRLRAGYKQNLWRHKKKSICRNTSELLSLWRQKKWYGETVANRNMAVPSKNKSVDL